MDLYILCGVASKVPDLNRSIKTGGGECVGVFGIDGNAHDIVCTRLSQYQSFSNSFQMDKINLLAFEYTQTLEPIVKVPLVKS